MQIVGILLLVLLFLVAFLYCVYKSSKPGVLKNIRRVVNTLTNERKGLIDKVILDGVHLNSIFRGIKISLILPFY